MDGFILGLFIGIVVVMILLGFWNTLSGWQGRANAFYKPQKVEHFTDKTPAEIKDTADSAKAYIKLTIYTIFLLCWLGVDHYFPAIALQIYNALFSIFKILLNLIIELLTSLKEAIDSM